MEIEILNMIQKIRTPFGDFIMPIITKLGNAGIFWILLTIVLLIIPKTRKTGFFMLFSLVIEAGVCNLVLKALVARIRPFDVNTAVQLLVAKPTDYSFPSGHTGASFASCASLLFAGNKKIGWPAAVLAFLIAFSRLYLYVHYPTDVLAGVILGIASGFLGDFVAAKLWKKIEEVKNNKK